MSDEVKVDVPPPRYEPVGNFKQLICDEQEWLSRPAPWGIDKLPDEIKGRKQNLFNYHYFRRLAEPLSCPVCQPLVRELFTETGIETPLALVIGNNDWQISREQSRARYAADHPNGDCDAKQLIRSIAMYEGGIITQTELFNRVMDDIYSLHDGLNRNLQFAWSQQTRQVDSRWLALELVGPNPFRPIAFAPEWRTDTALSLARGMYDSRDFGAMPILADALQDAGCDNTDILNHCRDAKQTHVRGCWVVDLVLGKE